MTTLPQTAGARFPRVGSRSPSIPALAQGGPAAGAAASNAMNVSDVLRVLRANAWLIVTCLILSLIGGYLLNQYVFLKYMAEYTARAVLQVQMPSTIDPSNPVNAGGIIERGALEIRQKTLAQKMMSPDLWRPLLATDNRATGLASVPWLNKFRSPNGALDQAKAVRAISSNLRVNPTVMTELISAELSAPTPTDAKVVLEAIVNRLIATEQNDVSTGSSDERKALSNLLLRLNSQIDNLDAEINRSSAGLNGARDASGAGNGLPLARQMELQQLMTKRVEVQTDFGEAEGSYKSTASALDAGTTPSEVDMYIEQNNSIQRMTAEVEGMTSNYEAMRALNGDNHKQVQMMKVQIEATQTQLEAKRESLRISGGAMLRDTSMKKAMSLKNDLDAVNKQIADLEKTIGELNVEQLKFNTNKELKDYAIEKKQKIEERITILDANASRLTESRGTVRLWGGAIEEPKAMSFPDLKTTLAAAGVLGLGLSLGIAFLRELMDSSVRSPRDIARVGQLNLLGMIPHTDDDPQAANGEISLIISQEPHSIIAENFRQVRTRLQHTASLDTTRSLLVTSPGPGDGKTTVACNIAAGLALNGRKILLVDANFRRPALHTVFGVTNEAGLGSVLSQAATADSVVKKTSVPNLDVLTTGPRPANTTELLESQLLTDFIDRTLEEYDHVIFDAGPILLVSETVALAPRVDGVITVVRARANSRGLLTRMRDALRQLKAEHLGVVLNGVRQHSGGYYRRNIKNYYAYQNQD